MKPTAIPRRQVANFVMTKALRFSASSGREAWPFWEMQLARRTGMVIVPEANRVTKIRWGPD